ncbi:MAG: hypothetical protein RSD49_06735 [Hafnia sp.]
MSNETIASMMNYYQNKYLKDNDLDALEIEVNKTVEALKGETNCSMDWLEVDYMQNFINYNKYGKMFDIEKLDELTLAGHLRATIYRINMLSQHPANESLMQHLNASIDAIVKHGDKKIIEDLSRAICMQDNMAGNPLGITDEHLDIYHSVYNDAVPITDCVGIGHGKYWINKAELSLLEWKRFIQVLLDSIKNFTDRDKKHWLLIVNDKLFVNYISTEKDSDLYIRYKNKTILCLSGFNEDDFNTLITIVKRISEIIREIQNQSYRKKFVSNIEQLRGVKSEEYFYFPLNTPDNSV